MISDFNILSKNLNRRIRKLHHTVLQFTKIIGWEMTDCLLTASTCWWPWQTLTLFWSELQILKEQKNQGKLISSRKRDLVFTFFPFFSQSLLYYAYYESYIILFHQTMQVIVIPVILPDSNRIFPGFSGFLTFLQIHISLCVIHHPIS